MISVERGKPTDTRMVWRPRTDGYRAAAARRRARCAGGGRRERGVARRRRTVAAVVAAAAAAEGQRTGDQRAGRVTGPGRVATNRRSAEAG